MRRRDPASLVQQGIWRTERLCAARSAHHVPLAIRLAGDLDVRALVDACEAVVARHAVLGAAFHEHDGVSWLGAATVRPHVAHVDLSTAPAHRVGLQLADLVRREAMRPFDVSRGPLARFTLCRVARGRHVLVVVAHRLVFDWASQEVLVRDLTCLYGAFSDGSPGSLPPLPPFRDQVADEQERAAAREAAAELWAGRWREPDAVVLPGLLRPVIGAEAGGCVRVALDADLDDALDRAARVLGATRFELLLAGLQSLVHLCGNADVVVAAGLSTRTAITRECIGPFTNELPVGLCRPSGTAFAELVAGVRAELRAAHAVREVPLASAVPALGPRVAAAPVSLSYRRRSGDPGFHGVDTEVEWTIATGTARNALHLELVDGPGSVGGNLVYAPGAMDREAAAALAARYSAVLRDAVADVEAPAVPAR
jgi:condensation domain-containing protein